MLLALFSVTLGQKLSTVAKMNSLGHLTLFLTALWLMLDVGLSGKVIQLFNFFYLDALSVFFIFVISLVALAASLYSITYIEDNVKTGEISPKKAAYYYLLFNFFCFSMLLVPSVSNLGMVWAAVEMTTLISAFLVGFYNTKQSVEAAWKYIIICSAGIIIALFGTVLLSYAYFLGTGAKSLNWPELLSAGAVLDKNILKIALLFILVGYGTKAGLAPMHTWLPDAHSQAVTPGSALLSGVLLKTSIYVLLRCSMISGASLGPQYFQHLLLMFGLISLVVSCVFILVQSDLKRLLAYSSIEHIGIICIGFGLATPLAVFGALLHILNHAATKALMFFGAGDVVRKFGKHNMHAIRGVIKTMPFTGSMLLIGLFALTGLPPFSIFISEFLIIFAAIAKGSFWTAGLVLGLVVIIFSAMLSHFSKMLFGKAVKDAEIAHEPLTGKLAFLFLLIPICLLGLYLPGFLNGTISSAVKVITGA
jgi:hydrogenase-4 component F